VQADCAIEVDGNAYSVPWRLIGERIQVTIADEVVHVSHAGREVAVHSRQAGWRQHLVDPAHFTGVAGFRAKGLPVRPAVMAADRPRRRGVPAGVVEHEHDAVLACGPGLLSKGGRQGGEERLGDAGREIPDRLGIETLVAVEGRRWAA
jgi:hypothetical protein